MNGKRTNPLSEAELQKAVLELAKRLRWRIARFPAANFVRTKDGREFVKPLGHDTKGFPDCLLVRDRVLAVEFKDAKGKLTVEQATWRGWLEEAGVTSFVWRPVDWLDGTIEHELRAHSAQRADALPRQVTRATNEHARTSTPDRTTVDKQAPKGEGRAQLRTGRRGGVRHA